MKEGRRKCVCVYVGGGGGGEKEAEGLERYSLGHTSQDPPSLLFHPLSLPPSLPPPSLDPHE